MFLSYDTKACKPWESKRRPIGFRECTEINDFRDLQYQSNELW